MSEKITVDRDAVERAISALDSITVWDNNTIGSMQAVRRASTDLRQALIQSDGQQQANDTQHLADMLWDSDEVMALNAELQLTIDQLVRLYRAMFTASQWDSGYEDQDK